MIDLPDYPAPASAGPALLDYGAALTPALGGPVQRVNRMGSRFRISVSMPPMRGDKLGRQWIARLIKGKSQGARMPFPMQGFNPGLPGNVQVDGAGQAGTSLAVKGATPNYTFREGQFFSTETGGQHYLAMVAEEVIADATGYAVLTVEPMLRVPPADGDACHFGKPMIEGFIQGDELAWEMSLADFIGISFALAERE